MDDYVLLIVQSVKTFTINTGEKEKRSFAQLI